MICPRCRLAGNIAGASVTMSPVKLRTIALAHSQCQWPTSCTCQHVTPGPAASEHAQRVYDQWRATTSEGTDHADLA
jgi:hypothetical protein